MTDRERVRALVEGFYADIWNRHDRSRIAALLHPDFTFRGSLGSARTGHEGFAAYVTGKPVEWAGAALFTVRAEKIADLWVLGDLDALRDLLDRNVRG